MRKLILSCFFLVVAIFGMQAQNGNVGINTTDPQETLHIKNGGLLVEGDPLIVGISAIPDTIVFDPNQIPFPTPDSSGYLFDTGGPNGDYNYSNGSTSFALDMSSVQPLAIRIEVIQMELAPDDSLIIDHQFILKNGDLGTFTIDGHYGFMEFFKTGVETAEGFEMKWNALFEIDTDSIATQGGGSRLMWIPGKRAIRSGRVVNNRWDMDSVGLYSSAFGYDVLAAGDHSFAAGEKTVARGVNSMAMGDESLATGISSVAIGFRNEAAGGYGPVALGTGNRALAEGAVAIGRGNYASGFYGSVALGADSYVTGTYGAFAGGNGCIVTGNQGSMALGDYNEVTGNFGSIALGSDNEVNGEWGCVAIGVQSITNGDQAAMAFGRRVRTNGRSSMTIGKGLGEFGTLNYLENNIDNSLMIGFLSDVPTFFVGPADSVSNSIGKVGIGTIFPSSTLHIDAPIGEQPLDIEVNGVKKFDILSTGETRIFADPGEDPFSVRSQGALKLSVFANGGTTLGAAVLPPENGLFVAGNTRLFNAVEIGTSLAPSGLLIYGSDNDGTTAGLVVRSGSQSMLIDGNEIDAENSELFLQANSDNDVIMALGGGRVGIGGSNPDRDVTIVDPDDDGSTFMNIKDATRELLIGTNSSGISLRSMTNHDVSFWTNSLRRMTIENTGNIGIGTGDPSALLEVNAFTVKKTGGGAWTANSDRRLKHNVIDYQEGLSEVLEIRPVKYQYNQKSGHDTSVQHIGVIAQELEKVAPYMVSSYEKDGEEYLQVDNSAMTYMLINAVQELNEKIRMLEEEIQVLRQ